MRAELKPTQKAVLKGLVDREGEWVKASEIRKISGVNTSHINNAIKFFIQNDYIHQPHGDSVMVSPDGIEAYYNG